MSTFFGSNQQFDEPLSFERFMEACLYDPVFGYYRQHPRKIFGAEGDYFTSPYTHRLFSACLAEAIGSYLRRLGTAKRLHLVELGSGEGILRDQLCEGLARSAPDLFEDLRYICIDLDRGEIPSDLTGVVLSNEFFDALPVHRLKIRRGRPREIYVEMRGDTFVEKEGEVSDPRIEPYLNAAFQVLREGWTYEVNLRLVEVLERLSERLKRGVILTLDYGYQWSEYDSLPRADGTLMCYSRHTAHNNPYLNVGRQDITSHVSFDIIRQFGSRKGWVNDPLMTQRDFLSQWGLLEMLPGETPELTPEQLRENLKLKALLLPGGVSDVIKVQVQKVGLD